MNNSACQIYKPKTRLLVTYASGAGGSDAVNFKVRTPDSRLRVKISLRFIPVAGNFPLTGLAGSASIWLAELDDDDSGVSGLEIPCTNIEGTSAAPTSIPAANGLLGYSREFVTAADSIYGAFIANPGGPIIGSWTLGVRYQPQAVRFSPEEWNEIRNQCGVDLITPSIVH